MFVEGLDVQWLKHSYLEHQFRIKNEQQIRTIKELGISHVYIKPEKEGEPTEDEVTEDEVEEDNISKESEGEAVEVEVGEDNITKESEGETVDNDIPIKRDLKGKVSTEADKKKVEPKEYTLEKENLLQIDKQLLVKGSFINFSLFHKDGLYTRALVEYQDRDIEITETRLPAEGEVLIGSKDLQKYKEYLKAIVNYKTSDTSFLNTIMNKVVKENSKIVMKELLINPRSGEKIKECRDVVEEITTLVMNNRGALKSLLTINKYDYYTYTHSVEVCLLSVGIAHVFGYSDEELFSIGIGSLLHDIGKSEIPPQIVNKPTILSGEEFEIMKEHVSKGFNMLKFHRDIPEDAFNPLLEHHEKLTGKGYPFGLKGKDIHHAGRIAAIADLYDALTTARPYKRAMSPFEALSSIKSEGEDYDDVIFKEFVKMLGQGLSQQ